MTVQPCGKYRFTSLAWILYWYKEFRLNKHYRRRFLDPSPNYSLCKWDITLKHLECMSLPTVYLSQTYFCLFFMVQWPLFEITFYESTKRLLLTFLGRFLVRECAVSKTFKISFLKIIEFSRFSKYTIENFCRKPADVRINQTKFGPVVNLR